uniref:Chitin-binding type-1 domain-containing protein n=1 Tax=Aegilops tauschii subsp. strangulata TaxID=200361 RepID=A0A453SXV6_AEGTS
NKSSKAHILAMKGLLLCALALAFAAVTTHAQLQSCPTRCGKQADGIECPNNLCCSKDGYCGLGVDYCSAGAGCQSGAAARRPTAHCALTTTVVAQVVAAATVENTAATAARTVLAGLISSVATWTMVSYAPTTSAAANTVTVA